MDRMLMLIGGLVFGLVVGFGASLMLLDRTPPLDESARKTRHASPGEPDQDQRTGDGSNDTVPRTPAAPVAADMEQGFASLEAALAAIPRERHHRGTGRITGRVFRASGEGLPGVVVRASAKPEQQKRTRPGAPPPIKSLEQEVQELVQRRARADALDVETVTNARGEFALDGIGDGTYRVAAYREGYELRASDWRTAGDAGAGEHVTFHASRRLGLDVTVQLPDGSEPARAVIHVRRDTRTEERAWKPGERRIVLPPGDHSLWAVAGDDGEYASSELHVKITEDDDSAGTILLELSGRNGVVGKVIRGPEEELNRMLPVRLLLYSTETEPSKARLIRDGRVTHALTEYSFHDLAPGRYLIGTGRDWNTIDVTTTVVIGETVERADLRLPDPEDAESHILFAYAPDDTPLTDLHALLSIEFSDGASHSTQVHLSRRAAGGKWLPLASHIEGARAKRTPSSSDCTLELRLQSERYGTEIIEVDPDAGREITVRFHEPATLAVTLTGYIGSGLEGNLTASLESSRQDSMRHYFGPNGQPTFDMHGKMQLGPVQPGQYRVEVKQLGGGQYGRQRGVISRDVTLVSGKNELSIDVPPLHTIVIRVPGESEATTLHMQSTVGNQYGGRSAEVDASGAAVFDHVPEGIYNVSDSRGLGDQMIVHVPRDRDVEFAPLPPNCMRVYVHSEDGALAKAGFESNDVMVAIEGQTFDNAMQMQAHFMAAAAKKEITVTVDRGGQMLELNLDLKEMTNPRAMGGSIFPTRR